MPRKARPYPKPERARTYIREWRTHAPKFGGKKLTLAKLSERLQVEFELELSEGQLSRIERGEQPYSQDLLEAIASICGTDPGSLIMRDPASISPFWTIWDTLTPTQQTQVVEIAKTIKRTGTEG